MFTQTTRSRAAGALFGIGATLITLLSPAYAATPALPTVQPRDRMEALSGSVFKPDLRVKFLSRSNSGLTVTYRFLVENVGTGTADNITLDKHVYQQPYDFSFETDQYSVGGIAFLGPDESKEVKLTCTPMSQRLCTGADLQASVADDIDPSNNKAHSK